MMAQFRMLQKVKRLREDKALRALEKARAALREAEARRDALDAELTESTATMPARERAIFTQFLKTVVGLDRIDAANGAVLDLRAQHQALADRLDRARDAVRRAEQKLVQARQELRQRQQDTEKIDTVANEVREEIETAAVAREEVEIEDLFSRPRGLASTLGATA